MTTNGKGNMREPSFGIQTRKGSIYVPTTNCIQSNRLVSDGRRKHWRSKCDHYFIPYYLEKKYRREDIPVLCKGGFS